MAGVVKHADALPDAAARVEVYRDAASDSLSGRGASAAGREKTQRPATTGTREASRSRNRRVRGALWNPRAKVIRVCAEFNTYDVLFCP